MEFAGEVGEVEERELEMILKTYVVAHLSKGFYLQSEMVNRWLKASSLPVVACYQPKNNREIAGLT